MNKNSLGKKHPLISVIVPIYGVESYLNRCVDSIICQSYTNLEVLLVDDGSPDKCGEICDNYAEKDNRVKVIHKKNGGLSDARNAAIDIMKGEYVVFVDSDDYVSVDYVETLYNLVTKYHCKLGVACLTEFYENEKPNTTHDSYKELVFNKWHGLEKMFYQELFDTTAPCKIYHRSLFERNLRFPYGLYYEDLQTIFILFLLADNIAFCNKKIYYYFQRQDSIENQVFNVLKLESALNVLRMFDSHSDELKQVDKAVRCRLLSFCFHVLLEMPHNYPDKRKQILIDYVKQNRWKVITDNKARRKARIGALISYLGLEVTKKILNGIKR